MVPLSDRRLAPYWPAMLGPNGDSIAVNAISIVGWVYGWTWSAASLSSNQSVFIVSGSSLVRRWWIAPQLSTMRLRVSDQGTPSMWASVGSEPGPTPSMKRPWERWSSITARSATWNGWWYGSEATPVPRRIREVRSSAAAMKTSLGPMISLPPEWCSPIHASAKPTDSAYWIISRSRCSARVGLCFA